MNKNLTLADPLFANQNDQSNSLYIFIKKITLVTMNMSKSTYPK